MDAKAWRDYAAAMGRPLVWGVLGIALSSCGTPPESPRDAEGGVRLTWVDLQQYSIPAPLPDPAGPARDLTVTVTVAYSALAFPAALEVAFRHAPSGEESFNRLDVAALAPAMATAVKGRFQFFALVRIPHLGSLTFDAVLVDAAGARSDRVLGHFAVSDSLGITVTSQSVLSETTNGP